MWKCHMRYYCLCTFRACRRRNDRKAEYGWLNDCSKQDQGMLAFELSFSPCPSTTSSSGVQRNCRGLESQLCQRMDAKKQVAQVILLKLKKGVWSDQDTYEVRAIADKAQKLFQADAASSKISFNAYYTAASHIFSGKVFCESNESGTALILYGIAFRFLLATAKAAAALAKVGSLLDESGDKFEDGEAVVKFVSNLLCSALTQQELRDRQSAAPYQALLLLERIEERVYSCSEEPSRVRTVGQIARNVAIVLHDQGHTQLATRALRMTCKLYVQWCQSGEFNDQIAECDVAKNYLLLASYQVNKNRDVVAGLQSLVWVIVLAPLDELCSDVSDGVAGRIKQWCIQKRTAVDGKVKGADDTMFASQLRVCLGQCPERNTSEIHKGILSSYVAILMRHSYGSAEERMLAVNELHDLESDSSCQCDVLLQKLVILQLTPSACLRDYLAVCDDAVERLSSSDGSQWMAAIFHMIRSVLMFEVASSVAEDGSRCGDARPFSSEILAAVRQAVSLWHELLPSGSNTGKKKTARTAIADTRSPQTLKAMSWAVHLLRLFGQPLEEIAVCRLLSRFVPSAAPHADRVLCAVAAVDVVTASCTSLASQGAVQHAACLLQAAERLSTGVKLPQPEADNVALHLDLARAAIAAQHGQADRCVDFLTSAAEKSSQSSACNGSLFAIAAQVSKLDPCCWQDAFHSPREGIPDIVVSTAPQLALWSFHSCRSRLKHVSGSSSSKLVANFVTNGHARSSSTSENDSSTSSSSSHVGQSHSCLYNAIYQYLDCCRLGARVYLHAGCPAEACSFINQGLALAQQHQLSHWETRFNLLQMECDVHGAGSSQSSTGDAQECRCDCVDTCLDALSIDGASTRHPCCAEGHGDEHLLSRANCVCNEARLVKFEHQVRLQPQDRHAGLLETAMAKGSWWESRRCAVLARHSLNTGQVARAREHCERGLSNLGLWPLSADSGKDALLTRTQRGCVCELLYVFAMCLCTGPDCQRYISESWLHSSDAAQAPPDASPSPQEAPASTKRQSRKASGTSTKAKKPSSSSSVKRRTAKSAVALSTAAVAQSSQIPALSSDAEDAVLCQACLERAYAIACQTATVPVWHLRDVCLALGNWYGWRRPQASIDYFQAAHSISLCYQLCHHISLQSKLSESSSIGALEVLASLRQQHSQMPTLLQHSMSALPADWTVSSLNLLHLPGQTQTHLVLARIRPQHFALVRLPLSVEVLAEGGGEESQMASHPDGVFDDLTAIMGEAASSLTIKQKAKFWAKRKLLDGRLASLVDNLESRLLGAWHVLLNGQPSRPQHNAELWRAAVASCAESLCKYTAITGALSPADQVHLAETLIEVCLHCWDDRSAFAQGLARFMSLEPGAGVLKKLVTCVRQACMGLEQPSDDCPPPHPVVLLCDKALQCLPWESMACMQEQTISRMPSLSLLLTHLSYRKKPALPVDRFLSDGINADHAFYVLNPEKNLPETQEMFEGWFGEHERWQGVVGCAPSADQFSQGLCEKELFIYCGHGTGSMFLGRRKVEKLQCKAVTLLMGCSSGKLWVDGDMDEQGTVLSYLLAGCPAIVAMLWDVTDRDLDRFTDSLLRNWLGSRRQLLQFVNSAREECRLPYLTGAAPIVYGLPVKCS